MFHSDRNEIFEVAIDQLVVGNTTAHFLAHPVHRSLLDK